MAAAEVSSGLMAQGNKRWAAGKLDEAQKAFEQAVKADPGSVAAHIKLGGFQLARNDFSHSIQSYQRVIGLDPKNVLAWIGLGIAYLHTGKNELSRAAFDEAVKIEPKRGEQLVAVMERLNAAE